MRLSNLNCKGTVLIQADLQGADLSGTLFKIQEPGVFSFVSGSTGFEKAIFLGAELSGSNLQMLWLPAASFSGARLCFAQLTVCMLDEADFAQADLTGASLRHASCVRAVFTDANLSGADLAFADLEKVVGQFGCYSFAKDTSISARRCSRNAASSSLRPW